MLYILNSEIYFSEKPSSLVTSPFPALQWGDSSPYFIDVYDITSAQFPLLCPNVVSHVKKPFMIPRRLG